MSAPIIHGPNYSTYVRTTRLVLEEKPAAYELAEVAMVKGEHKESAFLKLNPFGRLPAFEHDGMTLYETAAITRYIDRAFAGAKLQPADAKRLALMDQTIGIADSYAYGCIIGKLVWQRMVTPMLGGTPDDATVKEAIPQIRLCLAEFARILGGAAWFGGDAVSLGDLHLAPIFGYMTMTPEGPDLLRPHDTLAGWWERMSARASMAKTQPKRLAG